MGVQKPLVESKGLFPPHVSAPVSSGHPPTVSILRWSHGHRIACRASTLRGGSPRDP